MIFPVLFLFAIFSAEAQNDLSFQSPPTFVAGTFSLDLETHIPKTLTIGLLKKAKKTDYFITFSPGQSGVFSNRLAVDGFGNSTGYQIYGDAVQRNILKDTSVPLSASEVLSGTFPDINQDQVQSQLFSIAVSGLQFPAAGNYSDTVVMKLYKGKYTTPGPLHDSASFILTITVPRMLFIALVPEGSPFDLLSTALALNFGVLTLGSRRTADLIVRGNVPYRIGVTSQHGGVLRTPDITDNGSVPYAFTIDGRTTVLPKGVSATVVTGAARTGLNGSRYSLAFTIGDFSTAPAGSYSDTLTFTITAN
jgi:spore coat protein U-like protein